MKNNEMLHASARIQQILIQYTMTYNNIYIYIETYHYLSRGGDERKKNMYVRIDMYVRMDIMVKYGGLG